MRTIIAGSRGIEGKEAERLIERGVAGLPSKPTVVLSGGARGIDRAGEAWAAERGIPVEFFPAEWGRLGRKAGVLRNEEMAENAEALVAVWDGASPGTRDMIARARRYGLAIVLVDRGGGTTREGGTPRRSHEEPLGASRSPAG